MFIERFIWLILTRINPPLKSAGDFPKIMSNRITREKPINVNIYDQMNDHLKVHLNGAIYVMNVHVHIFLNF